MVVESWNRVTEDVAKDEKKYDYKSLSYEEKPYVQDIGNVSNESDNLENGIYKPTTVQKKRKDSGRIGIIASSLILTGIVIWLLVLTLIREQQIKALKENLRDIRSDVNILKKRLLEDDLIEDVKAFEDAIYADPDSDGNPDHVIEHEDNDFFINDGRPSDEMNEDELDDEDMVSESGDWAYDDEDRDSKTDFDLPENTEEVLGEVLEGRLNIEGGIDDVDIADSRKVLKILKDDSKSEERAKREVIDHTKDGVLVLSEPYRMARLMNESVSPDERTKVYKTLESAQRQTPKMMQEWEDKDMLQKRRKNTSPKKYGQSTPEGQWPKTTPMDLSSESSTVHPSLTYRKSRVMKTDENKGQTFRKVIRFRRPMLRNGDYANEGHDGGVTPSEYVQHRRRRKQRPTNWGGIRNLESMENLDEVELVKGPLEGTNKHLNNIAAHFNGDTTGYMIGRHEHYDGNGRLRHPHDTPYTAWKAAPWLRLTAADRRFRLDDNGAVTITDEGIYLIYAQILYHDEHDSNSYKVYRSNGYQDETLLQCTTSVLSMSRVDKASSCFTSAAVHLRAGDKVSLKNLGSMRYSIMEPGKSFFGFVKLYDLGTA